MADEIIDESIKVGARNSRTDASRLQMIHDYAVENGAACDMPDDADKSLHLVDDDTLISFGDEVKATLVNGMLEVGAYGIRFGKSNEPDLTGRDWFGEDTDFGPGSGNGAAAMVHHGLPVAKGLEGFNLKTFKNPVTTAKDKIGVFVKHLIDMGDEYEKAIGDLITSGRVKMRWSSGAAGHAVQRDSKTGQIKLWLPAEFSYTPTAAEYRLPAIVPLKSYQPTMLDVEATPQAEQENRDEAQTQTAATDQPIKSLGEKEMETEVKQEAAPQADPVAELTASVKAMRDEFTALKKEPPIATKGFNINKDGLGDSEVKSFLKYWRTGEKDPNYMKASNAVDMQEGTAGEGGVTVPTGLYNMIIARKMESSLSDKLGLRPIPGKGLTVNVPIDDEADGEFVATNEEAAFDKDTPALNVAAMTLVKYTKEMLFSYELLEDEDVNLMAFIADWIGRGLAKTQNSLIVTAAASGTALKTYASATAIAAGDLEAMVYNSTVSYYLDDSNSNAWVMRPSTYAALSVLGSSSLRWYAATEQGSNAATLRPTLFGYPVYFSEKAAATAASAKDVYFGNWNFMGKREGAGLTVLRDPYSNAHTGQLTMRYYFRAKYLVLQAAAIGYGVHPSA